MLTFQKSLKVSNKLAQEILPFNKMIQKRNWFSDTMILHKFKESYNLRLY
jgi:hypothetical protein